MVGRGRVNAIAAASGKAPRLADTVDALIAATAPGFQKPLQYSKPVVKSCMHLLNGPQTETRSSFRSTSLDGETQCSRLIPSLYAKRDNGRISSVAGNATDGSVLPRFERLKPRRSRRDLHGSRPGVCEHAGLFRRGLRNQTRAGSIALRAGAVIVPVTRGGMSSAGVGVFFGERRTPRGGGRHNHKMPVVNKSRATRVPADRFLPNTLPIVLAGGSAIAH